MPGFLKAAIVTAAACATLIVFGGLTGSLSAAAPAAAPATAQPARQPAANAPLDKRAVEKIVHDYLLAHPELLVEMSSRLDAKMAADEQKAQADALASLPRGALLDPKIAFVTGPADAKVTIVEFFDYRCVHCKNSLPAVRKVVLGGEKVRFVFIEYPILTVDSLVAARAAVAARRQKDKYVAFHFALMDTQGDLPEDRILDIAQKAGLDVVKLKKDMDDPAVLETIRAANELATKLHVSGTPTFIIGGKFVGGEMTYDSMEAMIKAAKS